MGRRSVLVTVVVLVVVIGGMVAWKVLHAEKHAPPVEPAAPAQVQEAAEPAIDEPTAPEPVAQVVEETLEELPSADEIGGDIVPVVQLGEPEILDTRAEELLATMERLHGKDRIGSMKCSVAGEMGELVKTASTVFFVPPGKLSSEMTMTFADTAMQIYYVTDGVFVETGTIGPNGTRTPTEFGDSVPERPSMTTLLSFNEFSAANVQLLEARDVTADATDPLFQKADGTPLDNLKLVLIRGLQGEGRSFELFLNHTNCRLVAMKVYEGDKLKIEVSQVGYEDIGDGIMYPVEYKITTGTAEDAPRDITVKMSDIVINEAIDESVFHFTSKAKH